MITVLLVGMREETREVLRTTLDAERDLAVVGETGDADEVPRLMRKTRPDVVLLGTGQALGAAELTRRLMNEMPVPVLVMASEVAGAEAFDALRQGAIDILPARDQFSPAQATQLARSVRAAAGVKLLRKGLSRTTPAAASIDGAIVGIGASTGGPPALALILGALGPEFPAPILLVQHMVDGFIGQFVEWLSTAIRLCVKVAANGEMPVPGTVYVAEGGHLALDVKGRIEILDRPPVDGLRPAANVLFESLARAGWARRIGVLLTGMGEDGASGLKALRDAGGHTLAQDEATSVVFGMPKSAIERGAVDEVVALENIAPRLVELVGSGAAGRRGRTSSRSMDQP